MLQEAVHPHYPRAAIVRSTKPAGVPCSVGSGQRPCLHGPTPEAGERPHPQGLGERSFGIAVGRASVRATLPTPKGAMPIPVRRHVARPIPPKWVQQGVSLLQAVSICVADRWMLWMT